MSYTTRLQRQRNAHLHGEGKQEKFFSKQQDKSENSQKPAFFQTKLTVNEPGDKYEKEADAVAENVVNKPSQVPRVQEKGVGALQRLGTPIEEKMPATNDGRMQEDKDIQEKPIQRVEAEPEKEDMAGIQKMEAPVQEEEESHESAAIQKKEDGGGSAASPALSAKIENCAGKGRALPAKTLQEMNLSLGTDFSSVKIHTDSQAVQMCNELNAQAFTNGNDIYFNEGKFDPESDNGKKLLAHELTHVAQQGKVQSNNIQRDLKESLPVSDGTFEIDMTANNGASQNPKSTYADMDGSIKFMPDVTAPYSNEIKLIQIVQTRDSDGADAGAKSIPPEHAESLRTTENKANRVEGGFITDVLHQNFDENGPTNISAPGSQKDMAYEGAQPIFGFKRSDQIADIKAAEITDTPSTNFNDDFEFETVAKGVDTNTVYGSLHWSFSTRDGQVINESADSVDVNSPTFNAALESHRDFYVHEPVIFYFQSGSQEMTADEANKIDVFKEYLTKFPDVKLLLTGYADTEGGAFDNMQLSVSRAEHVMTTLFRKGIDESRIDDIIIGRGGTEQFTSGKLAPNAGRGQELEANRRGNRRVVLTFEHTASN